MIEKIRIRGYRKYKDLTIKPIDGMNILVGDNGSGKSTILEAMNLAMTGRINGHTAQQELNPYWFNKALVADFFAQRKAGNQVEPPTISIEVFFKDDIDLQRLKGANNSEVPTRACPGVEMCIEPNPEFENELKTYLQTETSILPVEYYVAKWRTFADVPLVFRPTGLMTAMIDSRTIRSTSGIDYYLRQMLSDHLLPKEKAEISVAYRSVKEKMTTDRLVGVNKKMGDLEGTLDGQPLALAMDQSSKTAWDASVSPFIGDLPFSIAGQGQQVAVKVALAMSRSAGVAQVVMIEEPENHLSHTNLNKLVERIDRQRGQHEQQIFVATHSSYVLNRLGLDALQLISDNRATTFSDLSPETVNYFRRLPGYDTLRLVLASKVVLVEGPSDEIIFERFYYDAYNKRPIENGIDVISMRGLSLAKCLELAQALNKTCAALRDNDGTDPAALQASLTDLLSSNRRLFIGQPSFGHTLEPQILKANATADFHDVLGIETRANPETWMTNNKTEAAIRIADSTIYLKPPQYISDAVKFIHEN